MWLASWSATYAHRQAWTSIPDGVYQARGRGSDGLQAPLAGQLGTEPIRTFEQGIVVEH